MDNQRSEILDLSQEVIKQLGKLTAFFENATLMNIYLQTQIIHKLFEDNEEIEISKLELFHLQFTSTLISLMEKIKLKNERAVAMFQHEIELNNNMIEQIRTLIAKEGGFDAEKIQQAQKMARSLRNLYVAIYNNTSDYPFNEDISSFGINFYKDHFYEVTRELFEQVTAYSKENIFRQAHASIDKRLLLALGEARFGVIFFAGVTAYPMMMEMYKIYGTESYFLYWASKNLFLPCDINLFPYKEWEDEMGKKSRMIRNLTKNNSKAEANIRNTYKYISHEIEELLEENYQTISSLDFLASLEDINTQANILKAMLDVKTLF